MKEKTRIGIVTGIDTEEGSAMQGGLSDVSGVVAGEEATKGEDGQGRESKKRDREHSVLPIP